MYLGHGAAGRCTDDIRSRDGEGLGLGVLWRNRRAECVELWTGGVNECALWRHGTRRRVRTVRLTGGIGYGAAAMPCGMSHQCDGWVGRWSTRRTRPPCRHQASTSLLLALAGCVNFNGPSKMETKKFEPLRLKQMTAC
jgi:hypothetical protein